MEPGLSVAGEGPATFQKETCRTCNSGRIQPVQQRAHYANHPYREQSPMTACQPCQVVIHWPFRQRFQSESCSNYNDPFDDQKCQRCALATRKSRNTWMRATALSSSG